MKEKPALKRLTTGTSDFPKLILEGEGKYVDKTAILYELARYKTDAQYFISRPRRFGKSLMLSTLQAMFEGRRELFKGLAIDSLPWECWDEEKRYPVYNFSMSKAVGSTYTDFRKQLEKLVKFLCDQAGIPFPKDGTPAGKFNDFLIAAAAKSTTKQIVVLIDEYDEPVAKFLDDSKTLQRVRSELHDFFEQLKTNSACIRFLMMTGVTKLTKLSVFSGLNHLTDISMTSKFATLLGYTHEELDGALRENVEAFGVQRGWDFATAKAKLLDWYDGYRFSPKNETRVINPVSLGKLFDKGDGVLRSYWETTGSATLVFNRLKAAGKIPPDLENVLVKPIQLDVCDAETLPLESLLYQGGYLTIKEIIPSMDEEYRGIEAYDTYRLAPPNREIRESLREGYVSQILGIKEGVFDTIVDRAKQQIASGDMKSYLLKSLFSLYAAIPPEWMIKNEAEAKRYFLLFASLTGANLRPEEPSFFGYADAVVETPSNVYVFEFKYNRSAKAAIKQIRECGYADKWSGGERPVTLVGINYNSKERNIDLPIIEQL